MCGGVKFYRAIVGCAPFAPRGRKLFRCLSGLALRVCAIYSPSDGFECPGLNLSSESAPELRGLLCFLKFYVYTFGMLLLSLVGGIREQFFESYEGESDLRGVFGDF